MYEKSLKAVSPQLFTADSTLKGMVALADTSFFKVKQEVVITSANPNLPPLELEVKRVESKTLMFVGPKKANINERTDISRYTVASGAYIFANEQRRPSVPEQEIPRAIYEEEPTVAQRVVLVDPFGNKYKPENPLPVQLSEGSINIDTLNAELQVQLSHKDAPNKAADSIRIGDGVNEAAVTKVAGVGALNVRSVNGILSKPYNQLVIDAKNDSGDPLVIKSAYDGVPSQTVTIEYDEDGDLKRVQVSDS